MDEEKNIALKAEQDQKSAVESAYDYLEHFDILETITNVGNDEVFTPRKTCEMILDSLPEEVWHNPNYKWLNPASKNGIFEREIAIRLDRGLKNIIPDEETRRKHILQNMIYAIGQTKFTSYIARRTLYYCSDANRKCDGIKAQDGHYVNGYAIGNGTWFDDIEGNIKTPIAEHVFNKDNRCIYCKLPKTSKYIDSLQREQYAYEFIHHKPEELLTFLQDLFFKGDRKMKFDIIIGNPPYQLSDGGSANGMSATPIYNFFVENAVALNPKYISMIIPSRWYFGGKGLDNFRKFMLNSSHIKTLHDFSNFKDVFPSLGGLAGGACFFLWNREYKGDCSVVNNNSNKVAIRKLNEFEYFIRDNESLLILRKIINWCKKNNNNMFLNDIVSNRLPFGISTTYETVEKGIPCWFSQKVGIKYVRKEDIKDNQKIIDKWKLLVPKAPIAGQTDFTKPVMFFYDGNIVIAKPGEICSESWLVLNSFDSEKETMKFKKYVMTKIFRFLLLQTVVSQNITKKNFMFIPYLSNILENIDDNYLLKLFDLNKEDWQLINKKISNKII